MELDKQEEKQRSFIGVCPRCGEHTFEQLRTHNHCVNCLYFETKDDRNALVDVFLAEKAIAYFEKEISTKKRKCNNGKN